ncbi:flagellar hook-length control protein FliK [Arthrobacter sp. MYb227]|uniref:flagellar hook-length control protein FliK n=1 Tax=Arthrobacter sp. MYb227 TaxID=1848601 RepID=UPI0015E3DD93|nr:flagellar hook-length control protein FliK [Arthrobacter sp. MYb227]
MSPDTEKLLPTAKISAMFVIPAQTPDSTAVLPPAKEEAVSEPLCSPSAAPEDVSAPRQPDENAASLSHRELFESTTPLKQPTPETQGTLPASTTGPAAPKENAGVATNSPQTQTGMLPHPLMEATLLAESGSAGQLEPEVVGKRPLEQMAEEPRLISSSVEDSSSSATAFPTGASVNTAVLGAASQNTSLPPQAALIGHPDLALAEPSVEVPSQFFRPSAVPANLATMPVRTSSTEQHTTVVDTSQTTALAPQDPMVIDVPQPAAMHPQGSTVHLSPQIPALVSPGTIVLEAPETTTASLEATSGVSALAVESAVARGAQTVSLHRQLVGPLVALATGPHGERTLSINVAPDSLGPVTVRAYLGQEGLRVELSAPTEAGREALRALLPELRRDLAATGAGTLSLGTATDLGTGSGNPSAADGQRFGPGLPTHVSRERQPSDVPAVLPIADLVLPAPNSTHLDVLA